LEQEQTAPANRPIGRRHTSLSPTVRAANRWPVFVGVTGKRKFASDDPERDKELFDVFDQRFRALIEMLDERFPLTPKVLIAGGAAGVDQHAAQIALEPTGQGTPRHPAWSVVLMLPLPQVLFQEDFADDPRASSAFRQLADNPRVAVKVMPGLYQTPFDDALLPRPNMARIPEKRLSRQFPEFDGASRKQHYEQLGLWLAHSATLLVAGMPRDDKAARRGDIDDGRDSAQLGGTARVVAFRRTAMPDEEAEHIMRRSSEIPTASPIEEPDSAHVLLIDPTIKPPEGLPVEVLRPLREVCDVRAAGSRGPESFRRRIYQQPGHDKLDHHQTRESERRFGEACHVCDAFERLHRRQLPSHVLARFNFAKQVVRLPGGPNRWAKRALASVQAPAPFGDEEPVDFLTEVRKGDLDRQQKRAHDWNLGALLLMITLFLTAILSYEVYIEVWPKQHWVLLLHASLLLLIAFIVLMVKQARLERRDQDYRGVKEMLRVQTAWWYAGIDCMVDRVHLRSVDSDLRWVRMAAATIALWARLRSRALGPVWGGVRKTISVESVHRWISEQISYFRRNANRQSRRKRRVDEIFRVVFLAAISCMVGLFVALLVAEHYADAQHQFTGLRSIATWLWPVLAVILTVTWIPEFRQNFQRIFGWAQRKSADASKKGTNRGRESMVRTSILVTLLTAVTLDGAFVLIPWVANLFENEQNGVNVDQEAFRVAALIGTALLLTAAGMARLYIEKLNYAAQAAYYDDMLRAFRRVQDHLDRSRDANVGDLAVVLQLGQLALRENEAWLKAHRERPTEPIAGV
jgi:hypothetical protein